MNFLKLLGRFIPRFKWRILAYILLNFVSSICSAFSFMAVIPLLKVLFGLSAETFEHIDSASISSYSEAVDALVNNIISPLIGLLFNSDFSDLALMVGDVSIGYGAFITAVLNFLIVSFTLFVVIKAANKAASLRKAPEEAPKAPTTKICPYCKSEIAIDATRCPHCTSQL